MQVLSAGFEVSGEVVANVLHRSFEGGAGFGGLTKSFGGMGEGRRMS